MGRQAPPYRHRTFFCYKAWTNSRLRKLYKISASQIGFTPTQFVIFGPKCIFGGISPRLYEAHKTAKINAKKNKAIHPPTVNM